MKQCALAQRSLAKLIPNLRDYLTIEEELQIHEQFLKGGWKPDSQVLWSGIPCGTAQSWADKHSMQTLTTAMGPLMDHNDTLCLKRTKSPEKWSKYIKGASVVFTWHISQGERVTVLSPPPPKKFHPSGMTTYQTIEEPILKEARAGGATIQMGMVHPVVEGAEDVCYLIWPVDETATWAAAFGSRATYAHQWRPVKKNPPQMLIKKAV